MWSSRWCAHQKNGRCRGPSCRAATERIPPDSPEPCPATPGRPFQRDFWIRGSKPRYPDRVLPLWVSAATRRSTLSGTSYSRLPRLHAPHTVIRETGRRCHFPLVNCDRAPQSLNRRRGQSSLTSFPFLPKGYTPSLIPSRPSRDPRSPPMTSVLITYQVTVAIRASRLWTTTVILRTNLASARPTRAALRRNASTDHGRSLGTVSTPCYLTTKILDPHVGLRGDVQPELRRTSHSERHHDSCVLPLAQLPPSTATMVRGDRIPLH